ncbi:hypothetical protein CPB84DRAFT_1759104, partial [Gymnopilus junonius]
MKSFIVIIVALATTALAARVEDTTKRGDTGSLNESATLSSSPPGYTEVESRLPPPPPGCFWDGRAPFCLASCPNGYNEVARIPCSREHAAFQRYGFPLLQGLN